MKKIITIFLLLFQVSLALASEITTVFHETFSSHYEPGKCGLNILGLLERSEKVGANIYNSHLIEITNVGFSVFGLVNVEWARQAGRLNPEYPANSTFRNLPGERNWYHHVILENDGMIYDFDFGNDPVVLPVKEYFEKMFLQEKTKAEGGDFFVGRKEKLEGYQIVVRPGLETLRAFKERKPSPEKAKLKLKEYLQEQ